MLRQMLWLFLALTLTPALWYLFERSWDRRLFRSGSGRVCTNLTAPQAREWLRANPETQVIDVRSIREFKRGALPNARNVSLGDPNFDAILAQLDVTKPVLVYCAGGYRSRKAVERLQSLDFVNIQHLHRGYLSWRER